MKSRVAVYAGGLLVALGVLFLINAIIPNTWALIIVAVGLAQIGLGWYFHVGGLMPGGVLTTGLGLILLAQSLSGQWDSWLYVWALLPALNGLGLLVASGMGVGGAGVRRTGLTWLGLGVATTLIFYLLYRYMPSQHLWPLIIVGLGAMFLVAAGLQRAPGMLIPGTIIAGIGALLYYQNLTGDWSSWAYAWALIPAFVGLGLLLTGVFIGKRGPRVVGLYFVILSLLAFFIFAAAFGRGQYWLTYAPVLLIAGGVLILLETLLQRRA